MKDRERPEERFDREERPLENLMEPPVSKTDTKTSKGSKQEDQEQQRDRPELVPQIVYELDADGRILYMNRTGLDAVGYASEDLEKGLNVLDLFAPEQQAGVALNLRRLLRGEEPAATEYTVRRKDGTVFPALAYSMPIGRDNKIVCIRGLCLDLTDLKCSRHDLERAFGPIRGLVKEPDDLPNDFADRPDQEISVRKLTEDALTGSEARYRMLVHNAREGIFIAQHERFRFVNPRVVEILGHSREVLLSKPFIEFIHQDDRDMVLQRYRRRIMGADLLSRYPIRMIGLDGTTKWIEIHVTRVTWDGLPGVLGFITDISDQKRAELALLESEEKHRTLIEDIEEGYYEISLSGNLTFFNNSLCKILRYAPEELSNLHYRGFMDEENARRCYETFLNVYRTGEPTRSYDWEIIRKDGTRRFVEVSISLVVNPEGEKVGLRGIVRDVTERRLLEQELERHRRELEERIQERTVELRRANEQLLTAQEDERKRVAQELHDGIGQSLTAIKFRLEGALALSDQQTTAEQASSLKGLIPLIQQAVEEVRRISMDLRPSVLDDLGILATIAWFCREFETAFSNIRIEKAISLEEEDVPEPLKIVIFRILQEALNNIAKHSGADRVALTLRKDQGTLKLVVEDNGVGFDPERVLSVNHARRGKGLPGMKDRIELSGGALTVVAKPHGGTTIQANWEGM